MTAIRYRSFLYAMLVFRMMTDVTAEAAETLDCDVSSRQMIAIRTLLCGSVAPNAPKCFTINFERKYLENAGLINIMNACGRKTLSVEWEAALKKYASILEPIGVCIGDQADLTELLELAKDRVAANTTECTFENKRYFESKLTQVSKIITAMKNPEKVSHALYGNLGLE